MTNFVHMSFCKIFFMSLCVCYASLRIMNYERSKMKTRMLLLLMNISMSAIYSILRIYLEMAPAYLIYYFFSTFLFSMIIKIGLLQGITLTLISNAITLISMLISSFITFLLTQFIVLVNIRQTIIECIIIGGIQLLLIYLFFRIKRFRNGFSFLKNNSINIVNIIGGISSIFIINIYLFYVIFENSLLRTLFVIYLVLGGLLMIKWIRSSITKHYKEKMKERTVELQAEQIKEKDKIINNLKEELSNALTINHKYNHRLSAMENAVSKLGEQLEFKEEYATEYAEILDSLKELSSEYKSELYNTSTETKLPKTNIFSIDNLLEYMKTQAIREKIDFNVELHGDINYMIKNIIPKNKLETLIADHVKDAIIAITSSNNTNKNILVKLGIKNKYYEFCISDTGIAFEIDTLLKLGLEKTTTHKDSGGSGIGFMTTFETMKECKASLIIEEYPISDNDYTKSVIIRFDGDNEYKIISYRAEEIKEQNKNSRITIEKYDK